MEFIKVASNNIESYCYENPDLYIKFLTGGTYKYKNVPNHVVFGFSVAESKGGYLSKNIKNYYDFEKI
jgi:hypothetical protein